MGVLGVVDEWMRRRMDGADGDEVMDGEVAACGGVVMMARPPRRPGCGGGRCWRRMSGEGEMC